MRRKEGRMIKEREVQLVAGGFSRENAFVLEGAAFDIGTRVIKWDEKGGFNQYLTNRSEVKVEDRKTGKVTTKVIAGKRYKKRAEGVASITQFFVHHSGGDGRNPSGMYETLHNQRGLSVHFAVEDDGRIYQFLDAVECAYHAGGHNGFSIGVECALYPDADASPDYYSAANCAKRGNLPHAVREEVLQGVRRRVFVMPDQQVEALARLAAGCWCGLMLRTGKQEFERPPAFPRAGNAIPRAVYAGHEKHVGLIGHLQCTDHKWDPAGFPWELFESRVAVLYQDMVARLT